MGKKIYKNNNNYIGRFIVLKQKGNYTLIEKIGLFCKKYAIVYKLDLTKNKPECKSSVFYSYLQDAVEDFNTKY